MEESEMVEYFLQALEPTYFGHLISNIGKSFNEVVKMGGMVEEGLKSSKIMSYLAIKTTTQAIQNGTGGVIGKKKKEDVATIDSGSCEIKSVKKPTVEGSVNKLSMTSGEPSMVAKKGSPSDVIAKQEKSKVVFPGVANKPIIIVEGARTDPIIIKPVTQLPVISTKAIPWNYERVILTYKGKVLVDNGSSANICPLSTLNKLKVDDERIHKNSICIRGFDGGGKDLVGDIVLELTMGLVEFTMEFQVLDVAVSYNLLLGRPWIHATKALSSTLHQMVKFEWDRLEIVVHGEDNLCAHSDGSVPFIKAEDEKGPWVYQVFEIVPVEKVPEGKCVPTLKITSASVMVAFEMLKNGFVPGKGLGASLQGIIQPVSLPENLGTFGLGFKPTTTDVRRAKRLKQKAWALPKLVSRLSRSFVKPGARKRPEMTVPNSMVDIDEELIEKFQRLFDDVNMVEVGEGLSTDLVVHKLPIDPAFLPVKQKLRKFKTDMSVKIKEEVTKQLDAKVIQVTRYHTWLANVVPVPKKDGKTRVMTSPTGKSKASIILAKKFTSYEVKYTPLERTSCALTWVAQKLKHYLSSYTTYLISRLDPLKYIFQKSMPTGMLAKWQILLTEFDILYVTRTAMKAQALADHLAENPVDEEYEPLRTYFPDKEVMHIDKVEKEEKPGWKLFFDGAANMKGVGIGAVLISKKRHHYPVTAQLRFYYTYNMAEYEACILGLRLAVDMGI
ncbi:uncharacterized protein [Nicotiana sylvestris]|uniref:uncharacterized protein n=1 Tax=Nicotiana sylvestris TaxID=4096 RepID=UPI00388CC2D0